MAKLRRMGPTIADQADIKWLARMWERIVASIDYPTKTFMLDTAAHLVMAYCRGQGMKMKGSWPSSYRNQRIGVRYEQRLILHVATATNREQEYPTLISMGLASPEAVTEMMQERTDERNDWQDQTLSP